MKLGQVPVYSPELFGEIDRKVLEREFLKIAEIFDQYAELIEAPAEAGAMTTRDLRLISPQRSGFNTQEDANIEFARRIDELEASGGSGGGEQVNIDGGNALSVYQFGQHIDGGLA